MSGQVYEVAPRGRREIRVVADAFRTITKGALGDFGGSFPIVEAAEFVLPEIFEDFALEVRTLGEMGADHGLTFPKTHTILLREDIYESACAGHGRDRLTIAHEIGHLLLRHTPVYARRSGRDGLASFRNPEWQASCFGAELLVFPDGLRATTDVTHVANVRRVSISAARYQMDVYRTEGLLR